MNQTDTLLRYLEGSLSAAETLSIEKAIADDQEIAAATRGFERVLRAERLAKTPDETLPENFDRAVMRRLLVAPAPNDRSASLLDLIGELLCTPFTYMREAGMWVPATAALLIALSLTPQFLRSGSESLMQPEADALSMYDASRDQPYTRLVNALTARIPAGYRAVSLEIAGWALPGDEVDVMWLYQAHNRSIAAMIAHQARVLSNERDEDTSQDAPGKSTVTLLVPAEDASKVELARTTGTIALSVRSPAVSASRPNVKPLSVSDDQAGREESPSFEFLGPDGQVERYIVRGGRPIPKT